MSAPYNVQVFAAPSTVKDVEVTTADTIKGAFAMAGIVDLSGSDISVTGPDGSTREVRNIDSTLGELEVTPGSILEAAKAIDGGDSMSVNVCFAPSTLENIAVTPETTFASAFAQAGFEVEEAAVSVTAPNGVSREVSNLDATLGEMAVEEGSFIEASRSIDGGAA